MVDVGSDALMQAAGNRLDAAVQTGANDRQGLPYRVAILRGQATAYLLLWISHAVCDGESQQLIYQDLADSIAARRSGRVRPAALADERNDDYVRTVLASADEAALHEERDLVAEFDSARWLFAASAHGPARLPGLVRRGIDGDPIRVLPHVLRAVAAAREVDAVPVTVDFHGRTNPRAHPLVG